MTLTLRYRCLSTTAFVVVLASSGFAEAVWVTIKNDTGKTIAVQESIVVNGQVKRGRPANLLPGETIREFLPGPAVKQIDVYDPQNPKLSLWCGSLNCQNEKQTYSIATAGGKVTVIPTTSPIKK